MVGASPPLMNDIITSLALVVVIDPELGAVLVPEFELWASTAAAPVPEIPEYSAIASVGKSQLVENDTVTVFEPAVAASIPVVI